MGGEVLKWEDVVRRHANDASRVDGSGKFASGAKSELEIFRSLVIGYHDDDWIFGGSRHQRQVKGTRSDGESRHTSTPNIEVEVPSNAVERGGVLQLREYLADKREYHAIPVYQCGAPVDSMRRLGSG
jgi:hypothetical protein